MKTNLACLIFLCLYSMFKGGYKEYDLSNGKLLKDSNLTNISEFKLYVKAFQFQNVNFTFYIERNNDIITEVIFYEYSGRYDQKAIAEKKQLVEREFGSGWLFSIPYIVTEPSTNYIAIRFELNHQTIYYLDVIAEVTNGIYDLINGKSEKVEEVVPGGAYAFYIPANEDQIVNINIKTNKINSPINKALITQFDSRYDPIYTSYNRDLRFTSENSNNQTILSTSYTIQADGRYYGDRTFFLHILIEVSNINYFIIEINVLKKDFFLNIGIEKTFYNLKAGISYYFFLDAKVRQTNTIFLSLNNLTNIPFKKVDIYEYINKYNHIYENRESESISFSRNENQLVASPISYRIIKSNSNYFAFKIKPLYDIDYIITLINREGESFNLTDGVPKVISNLKKGIVYNFIIEKIERLDIATIIIVLDESYIKALTKIDIIETRFKEHEYNSTSQSISFSNQDRQLVSSNSYVISNKFTTDMLLKITPDCDIDDFIILINIQKGEYNIYTYRNNQKIYNLKAKNNYYFYLPSWPNVALHFTLTINYMENLPFNHIFIYECWPQFTDCSSKKYQDLKFENKGNELVSSFVYKIGDESGFYTYIELSPDYDIEYIIPECEYHYNDDKNNNTIIILSIIGSCIFIIFIVIILIICVRKHKNSKNSNLIENSSKEPIYPQYYD